MTSTVSMEPESDGDMNDLCNAVLNYDNDIEMGLVSDNEKSINKFVLDNIYVEDGRLVVPALWNTEVEHRLPQNLGLARSVLKSTYKKYKDNTDVLCAYDDVIRDQLSKGIIQEVANPDKLGGASYLGHFAVIKEGNNSTKLRLRKRTW